MVVDMLNSVWFIVVFVVLMLMLLIRFDEFFLFVI